MSEDTNDNRFEDLIRHNTSKTVIDEYWNNKNKVVEEKQDDSTGRQQLSRTPSCISMTEQVISKAGFVLHNLGVGESIDEEETVGNTNVYQDYDRNNRNSNELPFKNNKDFLTSIGFDQKDQVEVQVPISSFKQSSLSDFFSDFNISQSIVNKAPIKNQYDNGQAPAPSGMKRSFSCGNDLDKKISSLADIDSEERDESDDFPVKESSNNCNRDNVCVEPDRLPDDNEEHKGCARNYNCRKLYGHLSDIIVEPPSSPVYQTLISGELPANPAEFPLLKFAIRKYIRACDRNNWDIEKVHLQNVYDEIEFFDKDNTGDVCKTTKQKKQKYMTKEDARLKRTNDLRRLHHESKVLSVTNECQNHFNKRMREELAQRQEKIRSQSIKNTNQPMKGTDESSMQRAKKSKCSLSVKPPKQLERKHDLSIIHMMTTEVLGGADLTSLDIDKIYYACQS